MSLAPCANKGYGRRCINSSMSVPVGITYTPLQALKHYTSVLSGFPLNPDTPPRPALSSAKVAKEDPDRHLKLQRFRLSL